MCVYVHYVLINVLLRNRANSLFSDTWKEIHSEELTHRVVESEKSCLAQRGWRPGSWLCISVQVLVARNRGSSVQAQGKTNALLWEHIPPPPSFPFLLFGPLTELCLTCLAFN